VAILIKLDSSGPAFFVQKRVGMNKRQFPLIKFRTMQLNSEAMEAQLEHFNEAAGPVFKIRDDPRVTRLRRSLRRWSIDELPQLFNVLVGHMRLAGPRPLSLRDVERFALDWQRRRFSARPGITCLWQVGGRSSLGFDEWMELDRRYIDSRSLLLNFKILWQAIPAVLHKTGAY
jgi:lipopolysaccharide/colanic/teichoic acid biosynthesis glycosyltransferase